MQTTTEIAEIAAIATYLAGDGRTGEEYRFSSRHRRACNTLAISHIEAARDEPSLYWDLIVSGCPALNETPLGMATELWECGVTLEDLEDSDQGDEVLKYEVYDTKTGLRVGQPTDRKRARAKRDRLDLEYGGCRYATRPVEPNPAGGWRPC